MNPDLASIYARLPHLPCRKLCQECCGPVLMSRAEWQQIHEIIPGKFGVQPGTMTCNQLCAATGQCKIYHHRPLICRLWGVVEKMRCPFGCVPEWWVDDATATRLLAEAQRL